MMRTEDERKDRAIVNETVRTGRTPLRLAGSADRYGVPMATEREQLTPAEQPLCASVGPA
jgi:hypothetical protein